MNKIMAALITAALLSGCTNIEHPRKLGEQPIKYPARAWELHVEADVHVLFDVDNDGNTKNIRIDDSPQSEFFALQVKHSIEKWYFKPGHPNKDVDYLLKFRQPRLHPINEIETKEN